MQDRILRINIQFLNIYGSWFQGKCELDGRVYTVNIQNERRGKVVRFPFDPPTRKELLVGVSGNTGLYVEDYLEYRGESEWVEIDSNEITYYIADHQDQFQIILIYLDRIL